ncbi:hypothetical protein NQ318_005029 [Aromia moschata]|uniref:Uncharacterized protein n=1 Tax=Aromia moschata TaxID=1265417 RepID=A0AAV8YAS4_9CUCU|nr:hypothetical protein NQ318_005029 [Aromia moschata]
MLRIWMEENNSARWSVGCYFVQWQKNTSFHRIIGRSPYKSLYGADPKIGLGSTNLPSDLIDKILTEEDLESINADENCNSIGTLSNNSHGPAEAESVDTSIEGHIQEESLSQESNRATVQVVYYQQIDTFTAEMMIY